MMSKSHSQKASTHASSMVEAFLTTQEEEKVVQAIVEAETQTSGEIRVHIEVFKKEGILFSFPEDTPTAQKQEVVYKRAQAVFTGLEMHQTKASNGVLIYVAVNLRQFVIYGDKGIHDKVGASFWENTRDAIATHFKNQAFATGLVTGVKAVGHALSDYFPYDPTTDTDELDNQISKADV